MPLHHPVMKSWNTPLAFLRNNIQTERTAVTELYRIKMSSAQDRYTSTQSYLQATKDTIFAAGGGIYGEEKYIQEAFEIPGFG